MSSGHFLCRERYRLELHWDSISYHDDGVAVLKGAYFSGPALREAEKVQAPDFIDLDLTPQHMVVLDSYYVVRLSWNTVEYRPDGTLFLGNPSLTNSYLKTIHKLQDTDYIIIDTEKHERETHPYYLMYESQVVREDQQVYKYSGE